MEQGTTNHARPRPLRPSSVGGSFLSVTVRVRARRPPGMRQPLGAGRTRPLLS